MVHTLQQQQHVLDNFSENGDGCIDNNNSCATQVTCNLCGSVYTSNQSLFQHIRAKHTVKPSDNWCTKSAGNPEETSIFSCPICNYYTCNEEQALYYHMNNGFQPS